MADAEKDVFTRGDANHDSQISKAEFQGLLKGWYEAEKKVYVYFHDKMMKMGKDAAASSTASGTTQAAQATPDVKATDADKQKVQEVVDQLDRLAKDTDKPASDKDMPEWQQLFNKIDTNKDGFLSLDEFKNKLSELYRGDLDEERKNWEELLSEATAAIATAAATSTAAAAPAATGTTPAQPATAVANAATATAGRTG